MAKNRLDAVLGEIAALRAQYDRPDDNGLAIVGSFARGEAGAHSDLDLTWFRAAPVPDKHRFFTFGKRLTSITFTTVADATAQLSRPQEAIWAARGLADMRIISDRAGAVEALRGRAATLDWGSLQPGADCYASRELAELGEEAAKLLNALASGDEYSAANAVTWLWSGLGKVMAVHLGVLMKSENSWLGEVETAAGRDTPWADWLRGAAGLGPAPAATASALGRAEAGIRLYRETARRLDAVIQADDRSTVQLVCRYIDNWLATHPVTD